MPHPQVTVERKELRRATWPDLRPNSSFRFIAERPDGAYGLCVRLEHGFLSTQGQWSVEEDFAEDAITEAYDVKLTEGNPP